LPLWPIFFTRFTPAIHRFNGENMTVEHRLIEIEIKLGHQDETLDALNRTVYQQQVQIDKLEKLCEALMRQVRDQANQSNTVLNEKPPHY
jgi:SlyX protein